MKRESNLINSSLRNKVLERDRHTCVKCRTTDNLELHHIIPIYKGGELGPDNLITLCGLCHKHAPDNPIELMKYLADPFRPPFDLAVEMAKRGFVAAMMLKEEEYEKAKENPVQYWQEKLGKNIKEAILWLYRQE